MTADASARRWAREWERAWREHDVARVARLYAPDASFRSGPFRDVQDAADYAAWAFRTEPAGPDVRFGRPFVVGEARAAVEWWAMTCDETGDPVTIAGVSLLAFDGAGLVVAQRDYWSVTAGRHEPHAGWGR